jgi:hypothetical protein
MSALGERLLVAARAARRDVVLIAPFVKVDVLTAVLKDIGDNIAVRVIARWIPAEIAVGVCDLEIFDVVSARSNAELYVHPLLHAKLYRFDDIGFFGSANLTGKALGWAAPANVELLHAPKELLSELLAFEAELLRSAIRVDATYRDLVREQVAKVKSNLITASDIFDTEMHEVNRIWLPTCRAPERLWSVYTDGESTRRHMVESAFEAAQADLAALGIAAGLPQKQFNQYVAATLGGMPLVQEIDIASRQGVTTAAAAALIEGSARGAPLPYPSPDMWEVLQAWLMHFFPDRYRREATTEVFRHGRVIG